MTPGAGTSTTTHEMTVEEEYMMNYDPNLEAKISFTKFGIDFSAEIPFLKSS